ncbi:MAG: DNA polymerase-3 subunit epsilon, partial [Shewanella sp.]
MVNFWWVKTVLWRKKMTTLPSPLNTYLEAITPALTTLFLDAPLMAIDLEMTGLDPIHDQVISIGLVPIINGVIPLEKA